MPEILLVRLFKNCLIAGRSCYYLAKAFYKYFYLHIVFSAPALYRRSSPAYYSMGQLADLMRSQLRELAQSDARQLRAIDEALKASRTIDGQLKRLK